MEQSERLDSVNEKLYKPREICEMFNIDPKTLLNWANNGKIEWIKTSGGHRRYVLNESQSDDSNIRDIYYCRIYSTDQQEELDYITDFAKQEFPDFEIITDIGSGINFKRKGFKHIIQITLEGNLGKLIIDHQDQLCVIGFDIIQLIVKQCGGEIVILDKTKKNKTTSSPKELMEVIGSITKIFSAKI